MKKALFVSRKFDLVGQSAPSRYFLDIVKRMELLGYDISIAKLDFESYTKTKSLNLSFPYRLILPGFQNFFNYNLSLSYIFIFKWLYKFKKRPKYQRATELIIKSEKRFLKKLSKTNYDVIFVDYFFLAEGLSFFFGKKIIITHDVWHQHYTVGKTKGYFGTLTSTEEKRLLSMADLVIAISQRDRRIFEGLGMKATNVIDLYPLIKVKRDITSHLIQSRIRSTSIIFVGSNYRANVYGLEWFLEEVWPLIDNENIQLKVIGNVKKYINPELTEKFNNVNFMGFVDDLSLYYDEAKFVISPLLEGSGVKIKNIEAIEYGLPIVTTSVGAQGLEHFKNQGMYIENTAREFANRIDDFFMYSDMISKSLTLMNERRIKVISQQQNLSELQTFLDE